MKYLFSENPMFLKNTQIRSKTKLKLQFCRSRLKNKKNHRTIFDVGIYMQNLNKILVSKFGNY